MAFVLVLKAPSDENIWPGVRNILSADHQSISYSHTHRNTFECFTPKDELAVTKCLRKLYYERDRNNRRKKLRGNK